MDYFAKRATRVGVLSFLAVIFSSGSLSAAPTEAPQVPDWSSSAVIDPRGRPNPYGWNAATWGSKIRAGRLHALQYPISVTGLLLPARPTLKVLNAKPGDPLFNFIRAMLSLNPEFQDFQGFWSWLGLHDYPQLEGEIPFPGHQRPEFPMGVTLIERDRTQGLTLSCATCHSSQLFGKPVLGLTNRFPRANSFFIHGKAGLKQISPRAFSVMTGATADEEAMYADTRDRIQSVGLKMPEVLGLDTSLAQVALSLARRAPTPWAERDPQWAQNPRPNFLDTWVADSKPAVWWNVKYKTRWLSDGSVLSGNPVFTNFLWNEIGRGADLPELVDWLTRNSAVVEELTTAVFATQAPRWREYLDPSLIRLDRAQRGEKLFQESCSGCHGTYQKAWSLSPVQFQEWKKANPDAELVDTVEVHYFPQTRVKDVGTDSGRREGMRALAEALNPLEFSKRFGIVVEEQKGYIPPPLEGIWARYPYFHNNSVPSLCQLMTPPEKRVSGYWSGDALDANKDYDSDCVGYPLGGRAPLAWRTGAESAEHYFDATRPGLTNGGHYAKIFTRADGTEKYSPEQKRDLLHFLKSL